MKWTDYMWYQASKEESISGHETFNEEYMRFMKRPTLLIARPNKYFNVKKEFDFGMSLIKGENITYFEK